VTGFRLICCVLFLSCSVVHAGEPAAADISQLQQENRQLQRQVRRLEVQVEALREELNAPNASQVIGGIGYIVGIFGVAGWIAARKKNGQGR